jgi:hypothetical protein
MGIFAQLKRFCLSVRVRFTPQKADMRLGTISGSHPTMVIVLIISYSVIAISGRSYRVQPKLKPSAPKLAR